MRLVGWRVAWPAFDLDRRTLVTAAVTALAFLLLFWEPIVTLARDWWTDPEAGHGLLLGPLAVILAWRRGLVPDRRGQPLLGFTLLFGAVLLRYLSGLAAELFTMRMSMFGAAGALVIFFFGMRQLLRWWLPVLLLVLSVPIPEVVLGSLSFPLQLQASKLGAAMLDWRHVPVQLAGNVLQLPGRSLFVTEACSGLRSLTALLALGLLMGGLWLGTVSGRVALLVVAIPVAMAINGLRIFVTGFLSYFVDPALGEGVMHYSEGWVLFIVALVILAGFTWLLARVERLWRSKRER
jgi:exosortase